MTSSSSSSGRDSRPDSFQKFVEVLAGLVPSPAPFKTPPPPLSFPSHPHRNRAVRPTEKLAGVHTVPPPYSSVFRRHGTVPPLIPRPLPFPHSCASPKTRVRFFVQCFELLVLELSSPVPEPPPTFFPAAPGRTTRGHHPHPNRRVALHLEVTFPEPGIHRNASPVEAERSAAATSSAPAIPRRPVSTTLPRPYDHPATAQI